MVIILRVKVSIITPDYHLKYLLMIFMTHIRMELILR